MVSYPSMGSIMSLFSAGANYGSGRRLCAGLLAAGGIARGVRGATPDFFFKKYMQNSAIWVPIRRAEVPH